MEAGAQRPRWEEGLYPSQAFILLSAQGCIHWENASFLSRALFQAVLMGRGNKAQPTATQSQQQDCGRSPDFSCTRIHSLLQGSGFSGTEPLSRLPFHRAGSTACSSGPLQQNVYSLVTSSSHRQKWGCHGALLPQLSGGWRVSRG